MRYQRVIEVLGMCVDDQGRTLMVEIEGRWSLPGGLVRHGEHPADAITRAVAEQTGYPVDVVRAIDVVTDIDRPARTRFSLHHDRIVLEVRAVGTPVVAALGTSHRWLTQTDMADVRLAPATARILGLRPSETDNHHGRRVSWAKVPSGSRTRRQRFAAYGLATDPAGHVLLTLISDGYPGAGSWHLPGGGTDFGESAAAGLTREITEETGQLGAITGLIGVSHRHHRDARGPEGRAMDWHGVRVVYRVEVPSPSPPRVMDHGGSTADAAWFTRAQALQLPLTEVARDMISNHLEVTDT
jgi:8-oxo-dGTP diphosphatase